MLDYTFTSMSKKENVSVINSTNFKNDNSKTITADSFIWQSERIRKCREISRREWTNIQVTKIQAALRSFGSVGSLAIINHMYSMQPVEIFHFCIWYAKKTADRYYIVKQSLSILIHEGQLHGHEYTAATKHINEGEIITCAQKNHHPEITTGQGTNRHTKSSIFIVHRNRLSRWLAQLAEKGLVPIWNVAHFRKLVSFISLWFIH